MTGTKEVASVCVSFLLRSGEGHGRHLYFSHNTWFLYILLYIVIECIIQDITSWVMPLGSVWRLGVGTARDFR